MKAFITYLILFLLSAAAMADCTTTSEEVAAQQEITTDVPAHLKGATITVRLADGRESSVPAEQYKVVPRKQQFLVSRYVQRETCSNALKNRVSVLGGAGPSNRLKVKQTGSTVEVSTATGAVGGLQYERNLNDRFSVGAQVQTNESALLLFGVGF